MAPHSTHSKGLTIAVAGALVMSPDSLLIRLVEVDQWSLLFWRGLLTGLALLAGLALLHRGRLAAHFRAIGFSGLLTAALLSLSALLFITAITRTSVANTLFILSTAPLFAAVTAWILLGEAPARHTWLAIFFALTGIGLIVFGSTGVGHWTGDLAALATAVAMAASFVLIRRSRARSMVPAMAVSGFLTALAVLPFGANPLAAASTDLLYLALMGLIVLPVSFGLVMLAPRYLPAPEVSLVLLLEAVIGPFWVWLALGEEPGGHAIAGGAMVILTLALHALWTLRRISRPRAPHPVLPGR